MANQLWIEVRDGRLVLVTELDGAAYLRAKGRGAQTRWVTATTLEEVAKAYGATSRLMQEARAAMEQMSGQAGEQTIQGATMYDEDQSEVVAYEAVLNDPDWHQTRKLALEGTVFRHEKHAATVHPGVQHKLFVWVCETRRPREHCPCGLYTLMWLDDHSTRTD